MQDEGLCDKVKTSGLGLPSEMVSYTMNGCAPEFALWSFVDLGYLTYYTSYLLATGAIKGEIGEEFAAGRRCCCRTNPWSRCNCCANSGRTSGKRG